MNEKHSKVKAVLGKALKKIKEVLIIAKDKIIEIAKKIFVYLKTNLLVTAILAYTLVAFILVLIATLALNEYIVSVCILFVIEAVMAALLHRAEIWKHGILVAAQVVAAVLIKRIPLIILCIIAYVAAILAMQIMAKGKSPKA